MPITPVGVEVAALEASILEWHQHHPVPVRPEGASSAEEVGDSDSESSHGQRQQRSSDIEEGTYVDAPPSVSDPPPSIGNICPLCRNVVTKKAL